MGAQKTDIVRAYEYVRIGGAEGEHRNVQPAAQAYPSTRCPDEGTWAPRR